MGLIRTVSPKSGRVWIGRPIGVKRQTIAKRLFFVQGHPGNGKSTIIARVLEKLRAKHPDLRVQGFYSREVKMDRTPIGLELCSVNGPKRIFTSINPIPDCLTNPPVYLKNHKVDVLGFESIALPELQLKEDTELFVVDEVGPTELLSKSFYPALIPILNSNIPVLGSLPYPLFSFKMKEVEAIRNRKDTQLYNVYLRNRKYVADPLYARLNQFFLYRKEEGRDKLKRDH